MVSCHGSIWCLNIWLQVSALMPSNICGTHAYSWIKEARKCVVLHRIPKCSVRSDIVADREKRGLQAVLLRRICPVANSVMHAEQLFKAAYREI
ncbi:hypothetical protein F5X98DRAFT_354856 [Xylaria grammica]|nr:hypothetical protein F5X98DRAFT_354856 [Xylaria grammica]